MSVYFMKNSVKLQGPTKLKVTTPKKIRKIMFAHLAKSCVLPKKKMIKYKMQFWFTDYSKTSNQEKLPKMWENI